MAVTNIERRLAKLEGPARASQFAEEGLLAAQRFREGIPSERDLEVLTSPGGLNGFTLDEIEELHDWLTDRLLADPNCPPDKRAELTADLEGRRAEKAKRAAWQQSMTAGAVV